MNRLIHLNHKYARESGMIYGRYTCRGYSSYLYFHSSQRKSSSKFRLLRRRKFDLVGAAPNALKADFDDITMLEPELRFSAHADSGRSNKVISYYTAHDFDFLTYVPVKITSPGSRVVPWLRKEMVFLILKIISAVLLSYSMHEYQKLY